MSLWPTFMVSPIKQQKQFKICQKHITSSECSLGYQLKPNNHHVIDDIVYHGYITASNKAKVIHWYKIDQLKDNLILTKI